MPTKIKRCLFVGLGGTGMRSLLNAKKLLMETYGEVPPMIGFLGVDTDSGVYDKQLDSKVGPVRLSPMEQMSIGMQQGAATKIYTHNKEHFTWIPDENVYALDTLSLLGAGQVRTNGRFAFIANYQQVEAKVKDVLGNISKAEFAHNLNYELIGSGQIEIHMAFSVCGGTGCGTFLDMAYLLHRVAPMAKVVGYAVLPEVFDAMISNVAEKSFIYPNAFGALQDLDWAMHFSTAGGQKFNMDYVNRQFDAVGRPFNSFYFVGNQNANGDTYLQADQLSEMVSLAMVTSAGELSGALASVSDNLEKVIQDGAMNIYNKTAWVAGLGVCEILFRGKALREAYATKVERRLIARLLNNSSQDVATLVDNWIDSPNVHIRENGGSAHDDVIDFLLAKNPRVKLQGINNKQNPKPEVDGYLSSSNVTPSARELQDKTQELTERVAAELRKLVQEQINQEGGVGLTLDILGGIGRQVDIFLSEMNEELTALQSQQPRVEAAITTAVQMLQKSASGMLAFLRGSEVEAKTKDLIAKVTQLAAIQRDILRHQHAITFFNGLKGDLLEQSRKVENIKSLLKKVAGDCEAVIARNSNAASTTQTFQIDLSEQLLKTVTYDDEQIVVSDFLHTLPSGMSLNDFDQLKSEQVHEMLWAYAFNLPSAKAKEETTLDSVINEMPTEDFRRLLDVAIKKSMPLLREDCGGAQVGRTAPPADSFYVGVSNLSSSRLMVGGQQESAGNKVTFKGLLSGTSSVHFANIGSTERIIIFRQFGVIPAYAIEGIDYYRPLYDAMPRRYHFDANNYRRMQGEEYDLQPKVATDDSLELWIMGLIFGLVKWDETKRQYVYQNKAEGRIIDDYWLPLAMYRNDAFTEFKKKLTIVREEFNAHFLQLRNDKGADYMNDIIATAKAEYYNPAEGKDAGQVKMTVDELKARGNEPILQLVENELITLQNL